MKLSKGGLSLGIAATALLALESLRHMGVLAHPLWQIAISASEGATVGGLADWFAVRALFRRIPIPLMSRHTNIILRKRKAVTEGLADMVQNEWLTPGSIRLHLDCVRLTDAFLKFIEQPERRAALFEYAKAGAQQLSNQITADGTVDWLEGLLAERIASEAARDFLAKEIRDGVKQMEESENKLTSWMTRAAKLFISDETELHQAEKLATRILEHISAKLGSEDLVRGILQHTREAVLAQLSDAESNLHTRLDRSIADVLEHLRSNAELREKIDVQVKESIVQILEHSRTMIGNIVRTSLAPEHLSDRAWLQRIEHRVGDDLQWIRLNGAIVGGAAAGLIGAIRLLAG